MGLGRTLGVALVGLDGAVVDVEADLSNGLPAFLIGGLPDAACRQSADRIKAGAANCGLPIPLRRITVNLSPASLPKTGSGFDLPIAVAVLASIALVPRGVAEAVAHVGEIGLDGSVRPVRGVLPSVLAARRHGCRTVVVPMANAAEARLVGGIEVVPVATLAEVVGWHRDIAAGVDPWVNDVVPDPVEPVPPPRDLADLVGQGEARYALELAAAGGHHLFLVGPPGAGKTLLAECLPSILPPLQESDALEVTAIHSVLGALPPGALVRVPPFVAPHHGASMAAVVGGGSSLVRPGLISQAHGGVLFLDEAPQFKPGVLQALRQPLESGRVVVARARHTVAYPARFQLVMAANPCPCGHGYGKGLACTCTPRDRRSYLAPLAGPLLDRVDVQLEVYPVPRADLVDGGGEASAPVLARVIQARARARSRWAGSPWTVNAQVPGAALRGGDLRLPTSVTRDADAALDRGILTLRGYDRVLRLAWTVADMAECPRPSRDHVGEALTLRIATVVAA